MKTMIWIGLNVIFVIAVLLIDNCGFIYWSKIDVEWVKASAALIQALAVIVAIYFAYRLNRKLEERVSSTSVGIAHVQFSLECQ